MARYHYERLENESASHLLLERSRSYNHSLTMLVFEPGPLRDREGRLDVDTVTRGIGNRLHLAPRFRQRLKWIPREDHPVFVDDHEFNLEYHVRHTALPAPGDRRKLQKLAGRIMSSKLHRTRPMWESWIVEGLEGGRFALINKVHSCMIESHSGADLWQVMLSPDPDESYDEAPEYKPRPMPSGLELARDELLERLRLPGRTLERLRRYTGETANLGEDLKRRMAAMARLFGYTVVPPRATPINGRLGPHRRIETLALPLDRVLAIHRQFDCTVHDVVLAVVCRALRRFLQAQLVHPASLDVRVSTPVQVPAEPGQDEIQEWIIELPVWQERPEATLELIRERTRAAYDESPALGARSLFSMARWSGSRTLALAARRLAVHTPVNLTVVNVPGAGKELFFMGARLEEAYGAAPLRGEQGLSITTTSYADKLCVTINADFDLVPGVADLSDAMIAALDELSQVGRRRGRKLTPVPATGGAA